MADLFFFALGDYGCGSPRVAQAMNTYSVKVGRAPDLVLSLGDHFYPCGVESVKDPLFKEIWADIFLKYKSLQVPWKAVLGNHDYMGNYQAQIDFTSDPANIGGFWQCPGKNYNFVHVLGEDTERRKTSVEFFALDTNGCQEDVRYIHPHLSEELHKSKEQLRAAFNESRADWKIVFGHHAMYTMGKHHVVQAHCLKDDVYTFRSGKSLVTDQGYGMEQVLIDGGVSAYFAGHEHWMQYTLASGIHHFVSGATGNAGFYGGKDKTARVSWMPLRPCLGFVAANVSHEQMVVRFVRASDIAVIHEVCIPRPAHSLAACCDPNERRS